MDARELDETDKLVQAARLLRMSAAGFARDHHGGIAASADPDGEKLDWYSVGILDALRCSRGYDKGKLRLLIYLILISENGPGDRARRSAERLISHLTHKDAARYIEAGRRAITRLLSGEKRAPADYAELLSDDTRSR